MKNEKEEKKEKYKEDWDIDAWNFLDPEDMWVMDKLIVSKTLGYQCGPMGSEVPCPDIYIVRPIINNLGMGHLSRFEHIEKTAINMHPAEFWCEVFVGKHISIDYEWGKPILSVEGTKHNDQPLQRFVKWEKTEDVLNLPECLVRIAEKYQFINCEFINGNLIEVHFRRNPDFRWGNSVMIPKWRDEPAHEDASGMDFIPDPPNYPSGREGVFIC